MIVFKTYFRIIRKNMSSLCIYLIIFLFMAVMVSDMTSSTMNNTFQQSNRAVTVIDRDGGTTLTKGLKTYLAKYNTLVELPDDTERLQDELFYRNVEYIAIIPQGFTKAFQAGETPKLETVTIPDSTSSIYIDLMVNNYLHTMHLYASYSALTEQQQLDEALKALSSQTDVTMKEYGRKTNADQPFLYYYTYLAYVLIALMMLGISTIMMVFNQPDLNRRNLCAPVKPRSMNAQLVLGNVVFAMVCLIALIAGSLVLFRDRLLNSGLFPYLCLNTLCFTMVCVAIGFLVGSLIHSYNVQTAMANVLSLGMSFLCGVFVPQSVLSESVLSVGRCLPAYWYVKATNTLCEMSVIDAAHLTPVYQAMLIQCGFAVAIFAAGVITMRLKRPR